MLKTREVFGYTLNTGRDLFDDLEQLDRHEALSTLGRKNNVGFYLSVILDGLYSVGVDVDELDFEQITAKTYEPAEHEKEQDGKDDDFVPLIDPITRSRARFPKHTVKKTIKHFLISGYLNNDILLDSPFDIVVELYNEAVNEQNKRQRQKR